ncbi:MAG: DNA polymerase III subunit alpha [Lactobacillus sp.]
MKIAAIQNMSTFTLLESPLRIASLIDGALTAGYGAVGLADVNVTYGLVNFYETAKEAGIKPLLGMTLRINGLVDTTNKYDLLLLAKTDEGYRNLLRLSSKVNLLTANGENQQVLQLPALKQYLADLIVITPANINSELRTLIETSTNLGGQLLRTLKQLVPADNLYLGVYASKAQLNYINYVQVASKQLGLPLVAVEDTRYLKPQDQFLRKSLQTIKAGQQLVDPEQLAHVLGSHFLRSTEALSAAYENMGLSGAVANTSKIATSCDAHVVFQSPVLPKYQQNVAVNSQVYLQELAETGLKGRFTSKVPQNYRQQLQYELKVIHQMGFDDYFLIVWDVVNYCHRVGITTGPGRGSACGSLVSYALKITEVDPLAYHLLFERFLNPARHEMPDIDLDIPDNRRDEVIRYMFEKYGMDHAAQILTFGTLAAKQALRDVGRVFGLGAVQLNQWAQSVPFAKTKITLAEAFKNSRAMQLLVAASSENKLLFETASRLEGIPRHTSIHAAGLVISDQSIASISGMQAGTLGIPVTQQTKRYVEALGLLKIDFLGLRNLTLLGDTLALIAKTGTKLNPNDIPLNDAATMQLFQAGETDAIFQFESAGIRQVLKNLHPDNFEDLVAVNALYRPGPMQHITSFIARKKGQETVSYPDKSLAQILKPTYGILVYQEQVMQTAQILAGFSLGEADILRRAMSKKNQSVLLQYRDKFIAGVVHQGHSKAVGERVYNYIEQFANYGFNRSHAVAYTKIAFWLAYLKVHYPAAFYTGLLNSTVGNRAKVQNYVVQAQQAQIKVLPPDINQSKLEFSLVGGQILTGLRAIKGVRIDFLKQIVKLEHPVKTLSDFLRQLEVKYLQSEAIKSLIKAGCFDRLGVNRNELLLNCDEIIENVKLTGQNLALAETLGEAPMQSAEAPTHAQQAEMEMATLGFSTTQTPLAVVEKYARKFAAQAFSAINIGESGITVGKLVSLKLIKTKKGTTMAFASFMDSAGQHEVVIFPGMYTKVQPLLKVGDIYVLKVRAQSDRFDASKRQFLLSNLRAVKLQQH